MHFIGVYFMNVPLRWASLVGLSGGSLSRVSLAGMLLYPPQSLCPPKSLCPLPPSQSLRPLPLPLSLPQSTFYLGSPRSFSRMQLAEASQGWKRVDSHSLATRATWIQL